MRGLNRTFCSRAWCPSSRSKGYTDCMHYELWDTASRNLLDDFATETEALTALAGMLAAGELDTTNDLLLLRVGGPGGGATVAGGADLARRVQAIAARHGQLVE